MTTTEPTDPTPATPTAVVSPETPGTEQVTEVIPEVSPDLEPDSAESKKYRKRAQQAEQERDTLAGQLADARGALLDAHLATMKGFSAGVTRAQLDAGGYGIGDILDEDGHVDAEALQTAIVGTREKLGIQSERMYVPNEGGSPSNMGADTWAEAFAPK